MDPDANLAEQLDLTKSLYRQFGTDETFTPTDVARLAELVEALDEWLRRGGALPKAWRVRR